LGETGGAPRIFLPPLGSGGRRSGYFGKNDRCWGCYHRQRCACYQLYPLAATADNTSNTRLATQSGSSCAL